MHSDEDFALALQLQEQFERDDKTTKPSFMDVPGSTPIKQSQHGVKTSSLVDPSWEFVDPTPDVHAMFIQFNKRFFWGKLDAVEVRWSPRMTSCAGVCCYQGRSGMCSVRLSVPLLKLRPRKDLVETLLHEMIHAYLFVTRNNRDRDGHGPEFHKHMDRINREAGTRISVYHNFYDEVRLYKQHWWRCDGSCQKQPPYFGMVKRAMNRAPGPNDLWWAGHQATCGGIYKKVREPEGFSDKKGKKSSATGKVASPTKGDIRNYFPFHGTGNSLGSNGNFEKKQNNNSIPNKFISKPKSVATSTNKKVIPGQGQNDGNGLGKDSSKIPARGSFDKSGIRGRGQGGMLANKGSGTLVVSGNRNNRTTTEPEMNGNVIMSADSAKTNVVPFSGKGYTLGAVSTVKEDKPWLARLDKVLSSQRQEQRKMGRLSSSQPQPGPTRSNGEGGSESVRSMQSSSRHGNVKPNRISSSQPQLNSVSSTGVDSTQQKHVEPKGIATTQHELLKRTSVSSTSGGLCKRMRDDNAICNEGEGTSSPALKVTCPSCNELISEHGLDTHLGFCLKPIFTANELPQDKDDCARNVKCPLCSKDVKEEDINTHIDECMELACDNKQNNVINSKESASISNLHTIRCPMCNKNMDQGDLENHLERCVESIFDTVVIEDSDEDEPSGDKEYPCPCCGALVKECLMNKHLDSCLSIEK